MLLAMMTLAFAGDPALAETSAADGRDTAVRKYLAERLEAGPLRITTVTTNGYGAVSSSSVNTWTIYKGQNTIIGTTAFATAVNDQAVLDDLAKRKKVSTAVSLGLLGGGLATIGLGVYELTIPAKREYGMGPGFLPGVILTSVGTTVLLGALYVPAFSRAHREYVPKWYTEEKAMGLVDGYNRAKLEELGINRDDVLGYLKTRTQVDLVVTPFIAANQVGVNVTF